MTNPATRATTMLLTVIAVVLVATGCGSDDRPTSKPKPKLTPTRAADPASSGDSVAGDIETDRRADAALKYDGEAAKLIDQLTPVARRAGAVAGTTGRTVPLAAIRRQARAARAIATHIRTMRTTDQVLLDANVELAAAATALASTYDALARIETTPAGRREEVLARAGSAFDTFAAHLATWNDILDADGRSFPRAMAANDHLGDVIAPFDLG